MRQKSAEITIIGGGVVGLSVALGLLQSGYQVALYDGKDDDLSASQGNFGLVWLQGKGANYAPYAHWSADAVAAWPDFALALQDLTGHDVALNQSGGFEFFTEHTEFEHFQADLARQQAHLDGRVKHQIFSGDEVRRLLPGVGPGVVGASYCALDAHVNPLQLLSALRLAVLKLGGLLHADAHVDHIDAAPGGAFHLNLHNGQRTSAERIVLCAGLGANTLAAQLGFCTRVKPQRGELLITEKLDTQLPFLSSTIRQVDSGGIQIGGSHADCGLDDSESLDVMAALAQHAVTVFPALARVRVLRAWGALRILSPDGYPVYARSPSHPGAFLVTCHSGITLASLHASVLSDWLVGSNPPNLDAFDERRFAISGAA